MFSLTQRLTYIRYIGVSQNPVITLARYLGDKYSKQRITGVLGGKRSANSAPQQNRIAHGKQSRQCQNVFYKIAHCFSSKLGKQYVHLLFFCQQLISIVLQAF
jgi:hypothetical protein